MAIRLTTPPETRPREPVRVKARSPLAGATVVNMSPAVADELQIDISSEGVAVAEIEPNSSAMRVGFQKGDVILAINGEPVKTSKDVERAAQGRRLALGDHHQSRRPGADDGAARLSDLFAAAGLDQSAPRPLADRLRPTKLSEVVGQDHLVGPDGALTRLLALGLARLARCSGGRRAPARPRSRGSSPTRPISISSRSRRSSRASPTSRRCSRRRAAGAPPARARCSSSTRSTASTAPSSTPSCR